MVSGQGWRGAARCPLPPPVTPGAPLWHPLKLGTAPLSPLASPSKQVGVFNCFIEICIINILQWTVKLFLESSTLVPGSCHYREEWDSGGNPSPVHGRQCLGMVTLTLGHFVTLLLCWATPLRAIMLSQDSCPGCLGQPPGLMQSALLGPPFPPCHR